jgi:hypothetical protein
MRIGWLFRKPIRIHAFISSEKMEFHMKRLKPKEQHERLLAAADKEMIVQHLGTGEHHDITQIAATLARQCNLYVHFQRLWLMRVSDLDEKLRTERYMQNIYVNRRVLNKRPTRTVSSEKGQPPVDPLATDTETDD